MKLVNTFLAVLLVSGATSYGGLYFNSAPSAAIPDGNPGGYQNSINVSGFTESIASVLVYLNISGGYNGDLYAYLNCGGTSVLLLNRIGQTLPGTPFGSSTAGFGGGSTWNNDGTLYSFRLSDTGLDGNVHAAIGSPVAGSYQPDGGTLSSFNGANPNGNWTIYFADMASGGGTGPSTLAGWGLEITAVPEPVNVALGIFGGVFALIVTFRSARVRALLRGWQVAASRWVDAV